EHDVNVFANRHAGCGLISELGVERKTQFAEEIYRLPLTGRLTKIFWAMCSPLEIVSTHLQQYVERKKGESTPNREIQVCPQERKSRPTWGGVLNILAELLKRDGRSGQNITMLVYPTPEVLVWPAAMIVWGPGFTTAGHRHHCVQLLMA